MALPMFLRNISNWRLGEQPLRPLHDVKASSLYTLVPPGMRSCSQPSDHFSLHRSSEELVAAEVWREQVKEPVVITVISDELKQMKAHLNFLFSLRRQGFTRIVALNVKPLQSGEFETDFWLRREAAMVTGLQALRADEVALVIDSTDVLFFAGPDVLLERFLRVGHDIVFGAEMLCDTLFCRQNSSLSDFMRSRAAVWSNGTRMSFLNAGNFIGRVGPMLKLVDDVHTRMSRTHEDDQAALVALWAGAPDRLTLDYAGGIFAVVPPTFSFFRTAWRIRESTQALENRLTGLSPPIVHFAGMRLAAYDTGVTHRSINPCQAFLASVYDRLLAGLEDGSSSSASAHHPRQRVVVSLTSTLRRLPHIRPALESLLRQSFEPDAIYLNIARPKHGWSSIPACSRGLLNCSESSMALGPAGDQVPVPNFLGEMLWTLAQQTGSSLVRVNWCTDVGPATKLLPTLRLERQPDTLLVTADDDVFYHAHVVADLVSAIRQWPHCAYNFAGQLIEPLNDGRYAVRSADKEEYHRAPTAVDILEAFLGAIYKRDFFTDTVFEIDAECFTTDDIHISQHLATHGIPRIKLPAQHLLQASSGQFQPTHVLPRLDSIGALRANNVFGTSKNVQCATRHVAVFRHSWLVRPRPCPVHYSPVLPVGVLTWTLSSHRAMNVQRLQSPCSSSDGLQTGASVLEQGQRLVHPGTGSAQLHLPSNLPGLLIDGRGQLCALHRNGSRACWSPSDVARRRESNRGSSSYVFKFQEDGNMCMYRKAEGSVTLKTTWCEGQVIDACSQHVGPGASCVLAVSDDAELTVSRSKLVIWQLQLQYARPDDMPSTFASLVIRSVTTAVDAVLGKAVVDHASRAEPHVSIARLGHRATHATRGTFLQPCHSSIASSDGTHEMIVTRDGQLCVHDVSDSFLRGSNATISMKCLEIGVKNTAPSPRFVAIQQDGNVCLYRGLGPSSNRGVVRCLPAQACMSRGHSCLLGLHEGPAKDGVRLQWRMSKTGDVAHELIFSRERDIQSDAACIRRSEPTTVEVRGQWETGWTFRAGQTLRLTEVIPGSATDVEASLEINQLGQMCSFSSANMAATQCMPSQVLFNASMWPPPSQELWAVLDRRGLLTMYTQWAMPGSAPVAICKQQCATYKSEWSVRCRWSECRGCHQCSTEQASTSGADGSRALWRVLLRPCKGVPCVLSPSKDGLIANGAVGDSNMSLQHCLGWSGFGSLAGQEGVPYGRRPLDTTSGALIECSPDGLAEGRQWQSDRDQVLPSQTRHDAMTKTQPCDTVRYLTLEGKTSCEQKIHDLTTEENLVAYQVRVARRHRHWCSVCLSPILPKAGEKRNLPTNNHLPSMWGWEHCVQCGLAIGLFFLVLRRQQCWSSRQARRMGHLATRAAVALAAAPHVSPMESLSEGWRRRQQAGRAPSCDGCVRL